jgi:ABC-type transporter Mla MlaB component
MGNKDDRPSLLAKMAKFVRNPTKDWSELDQPEQPQESGYDKQALKAMIERKRQNDFVRRREFEQLRKLRSKDPAAIAGMARPSFFQTSTAADQDAKASTLKKIDDIEAQMSKQWWKGKQDAASTQSNAQGAPTQQPDDAQNTVRNELSAPASATASQQFQPTEVVSIKQEMSSVDQDAVVTQMAPSVQVYAARTLPAAPLATDDAKRFMQGDPGFASSSLFAVSSEDMASDPELEEAAIRFANRDDTGAELGLLMALRGQNVAAQVGWPWAAALLDLYRATNKQESFEKALVEFGGYFERKMPTWIFLSEAVPSTGFLSTEPGSQMGGRDGPLWECPEVLSANALEQLRDVLSTNLMPWHLGWSKLKVIPVDAMPLLSALFHSLCEEPVTLRFSGGAALLQQLREATPANDRNVNLTWWHIRLTALRAMYLPDEFELAALQYCVTYGAAPVAWQDPQCIFEASDFNDLKVNAQSDEPDTTQAMGVTAHDTLPLELRGEILGDASQLLAQMDAVTDSSGPIVVSCAALLRVDFAAAGNILNWVAFRQSQGRQVQFRDTHRLVAAFFNVIGINEHARVLTRPI